jgi:hypothetical protein
MEKERDVTDDDALSKMHGMFHENEASVRCSSKESESFLFLL